MIVQQMTEKGGSALAQEMMENKMFVNVAHMFSAKTLLPKFKMFQISLKLHISMAYIA